MKAAVVGTGHVGLVIATCLADMGHTVIGVDQQQVVEALQQGNATFFEPGLLERVHQHVQGRRLQFTIRLEAVAEAQIIWIATDTTQTPDGDIHIDKVEQIVYRLGSLCSSNTVLAIKSTMPIGACRQLAKTLPNDGPSLVYNPEFLRQGVAIQDFFQQNKLVIGTGPRGGAEPLINIHAPLTLTPVITNWETAEAMKLAQNVFNALHISFMNELAMTMEHSGVCLEQVSQMLRENNLATSRYLHPGFSYGGSCLPNNIAYLNYFAHSKSYQAPLLQAIAAVNGLRVRHLVDTISQTVGDLKRQRIALWGLTYKAATDDLRNSPSVWVIQKLLDAGALLMAYDPHLRTDQIRELGCIPFETAEETLSGASALIVLTKCPEFAEIPVPSILNCIDRKRIFDPVGALPQLQEALCGY